MAGNLLAYETLPRDDHLPHSMWFANIEDELSVYHLWEFSKSRVHLYKTCQRFKVQPTGRGRVCCSGLGAVPGSSLPVRMEHTHAYIYIEA